MSQLSSQKHESGSYRLFTEDKVTPSIQPLDPKLRHSIITTSTLLSIAWAFCVFGLAVPCVVLNYFFPEYSRQQPPALSAGEHIGSFIAVLVLPKFANIYEALGRRSIVARLLRYSHLLFLASFLLISAYYWRGIPEDTNTIISGFICLMALQVIYALATADNDQWKGIHLPLTLFCIGALCLFIALPLYIHEGDFRIPRLLFITAFACNFLAFPLLGRALLKQIPRTEREIKL